MTASFAACLALLASQLTKSLATLFRAAQLGLLAQVERAAAQQTAALVVQTLAASSGLARLELFVQARHFLLDVMMRDGVTPDVVMANVSFARKMKGPVRMVMRMTTMMRMVAETIMPKMMSVMDMMRMTSVASMVTSTQCPRRTAAMMFTAVMFAAMMSTAAMMACVSTTAATATTTTMMMTAGMSTTAAVRTSLAVMTHVAMAMAMAMTTTMIMAHMVMAVTTTSMMASSSPDGTTQGLLCEVSILSASELILHLVMKLSRQFATLLSMGNGHVATLTNGANSAQESVLVVTGALGIALRAL